jgi:micrococcal nuclease
MRLVLLIGGIASVLALAASPLGGTGYAPAAPRLESAVVASIYDGDTLTLRDGRRVRLVQIDTPELASDECYGHAARSALVQLVPLGSRVGLAADPRLDRVDRYGRILRYVWRGKTNVNLELVRRGAAAPYFYRGDRGTYAAAILAAATRARAERRGLWKACPGTRLDPERAVDSGASGAPAEALAATGSGRCDPNYTGGCVPPYPPDVDCADLHRLGIARVRVVGRDVHNLDGDHDGWGCE